MEKSYDKIKDSTIFNITIPGSYISNAYNISKENLVCLGETNYQSFSDNAILYQQIQLLKNKSLLDDFYRKLNTENNDILSQLRSGFRYFDIRICKHNNIYYTANFLITNKLNDIITDMLKFLQSNNKEIIIIDFDNNLRTELGFMDVQEVNSFYTYLKNSLKNLIVTKSMMRYKISDLIKLNKRIILLSTNPVLKNYEEVWDRDSIVNDHYPQNIIIKKLALISNSLSMENNINRDIAFNIIPLYSQLSTQNISEDLDEYQRALILDTLKQNIENKPAIIVLDKSLNNQFIKIITGIAKIEDHSLLSTLTNPFNDLSIDQDGF